MQNENNKVESNNNNNQDIKPEEAAEKKLDSAKKMKILESIKTGKFNIKKGGNRKKINLI